jgi:putative tryptophan/tyrosine transport system substrate-binding protein
MRRRDFVSLLGGTAAAAAIARPLPLRAQPLTRAYRVAYLALAGDRDAMIVKQRLEELGYSETRNLMFDLRSAQGRPERLPALAAELVKSNPDVMVAGFGTATAKAAQAATAAVPIVFTAVGDPIGNGLVKSLSRPGANITGMHAQAADIMGKRLQVLEDIASGIRTIAVLLNQDAPFTAVVLPALRIAADARGQRLELCDVATAAQLSTSVAAAIKAGAGGLTVLETPLLLDLRREIVELAARLRLPAIYSNREFVDAGGLASYGADRPQLYRRAAELVDKILKGQKPADIPVEQPTKFELVINLKTAKVLGITIGPTLLALADEVIE